MEHIAYLIFKRGRSPGVSKGCTKYSRHAWVVNHVTYLSNGVSKYPYRFCKLCLITSMLYQIRQFCGMFIMKTQRFHNSIILNYENHRFTFWHVFIHVHTRKPISLCKYSDVNVSHSVIHLPFRKSRKLSIIH